MTQADPNDRLPDDRLTALIDGELTPAELAEIERALELDPALQAEHDELLAMVDFVREHGPVDAPAGFHARVLEATAELPMPGSLWRRVTRFFREMPIETMAVAVAAMLVIVAISESPEAPEPATGSATGSATVAQAPVDGAALPQPALVPTGQPSQVTAPPASAPESIAQRADPLTPRAKPVATADREQVLEELLGARASERGEDGLVALSQGEAGPSAAGSASSEVGSKMGELLSAPVSISLRSEDPQAIIQLEQLARQLGGRLIEPSTGEPLAAHTLSASDAQTPVAVRIPSAKVSEFIQAANRIGEARLISQRDNALYGGGDLDVRVEVSYTGGGKE